MFVKFRKRKTTDAMRVVIRDIHGADREQLYKKSRKIGDLDTGFHIVILSNGLVEFDRDIKAVASHRLPYNEESLYVLVDATEKPNDAQRNSLTRLSIEYGLPIEYVED